MGMTVIGHLKDRLGGNFEDLVSEALCFVLKETESVQAILKKLLAEAGADLGEDELHFFTRMADPEHGCPDILGKDASGTLRLLIEVKFGAALTQKQKTEYMMLLARDGPGTLCFLAPAHRLSFIATELNLDGVESTDGLRSGVMEEPHHQHVVLLSWERLLAALKPMKQDDCNIVQLVELIQRAGIMTFDPFQDGDLEARHGRVFRQLVKLVDELGTSSTPKGRLGSYMKRQEPPVAGRWPLDVVLSPRMWYKQDQKSPLWVAIRTGKGPEGRIVDSALKDHGWEKRVTLYNEEPTVALEIEEGISREDLLQSLREQITEIRQIAEDSAAAQS